jgi:hypothetical protein
MNKDLIKIRDWTEDQDAFEEFITILDKELQGESLWIWRMLRQGYHKKEIFKALGGTTRRRSKAWNLLIKEIKEIKWKYY